MKWCTWWVRCLPEEAPAAQHKILFQVIINGADCTVLKSYLDQCSVFRGESGLWSGGLIFALCRQSTRK